MSEMPYSDVERNQLILRDRLACDRTALANERTFLAYVRTALAFSVTGAAFLHFLEQSAMRVMGWALVAGGVVALVIGVIRFAQIHARIKRVRLDEAPAPRR